nr:Qat anti-phage system associated protein QatB [Ralstonia sp. UNC404CL21Col]
MRASTSAGAALFSFLNALSQGTSAEARQWVDALRATNPSAEDVVGAIVRELAPPGGSADEESFRDAMDFALSELIKDDPAVDPLSMGIDEIWELMKGYLATEAANRLCFDLGPIFESSQLDPRTAVIREREMRRFLKNEIGAHVDLLRINSANPTRSQLDGILQESLKMTFELFETDL